MLYLKTLYTFINYSNNLVLVFIFVFKFWLNFFVKKLERYKLKFKCNDVLKRDIYEMRI